MGILLVRHGEAVQERAGLDDAARWLSKHGRAQARSLGEQLREKQFMPIRVLASPRARALQTAELFVQTLGFRGVVEVQPSLSFTAPAERAARDLSSYAEDEDLAAFGHMPTIAEIAARLTGQQHEGPLALCEALWIQDGRVVWSVQPR